MLVAGLAIASGRSGEDVLATARRAALAWSVRRTCCRDDADGGVDRDDGTTPITTGRSSPAGTVTVRYFAAAAGQQISTPRSPRSRAADITEMTERHPPSPRCALADSTRVEGADEVRAGVTLDVLPPFAGELTG